MHKGDPTTKGCLRTGNVISGFRIQVLVLGLEVRLLFSAQELSHRQGKEST